MPFSEKKSYSFEEIKQKIADYCAYQDRSHFDVENKLKDFDVIPEAKELILEFLFENNFLNEERFVESFVRGKFNQKKWGKNKIKEGLFQKQIKGKLVDKALKNISEEKYHHTFTELADKKWPYIKGQNVLIKKQKLKNYLLQKGYEYSMIHEYINKL